MKVLAKVDHQNIHSSFMGTAYPLFNIYIQSTDKKDVSPQTFWYYILSRGSEVNNMFIWLFHVFFLFH